MKWSFVIQQKLKAALLLGGVMVIVILGNLLSRNHMRGIDRSFSSIYQDRLIPATTFTYLVENLYGKRLSLEKFLLSQDVQSTEQMARQLRAHDQTIDSLIRAFEKTYLVDKEIESLSAFKNRVQEYVLLEKMVVTMHSAGNMDDSKKLFEGAGAETFQSTVARLNELTNIQSDVGRELMKESKSDMAGFSLLSMLQVSLVVVIGLMIMILIQSARITNAPRAKKDEGQQFHLN
jgi:hypothetical protein